MYSLLVFVVVWQAIHSGSVTNRTGTENLSFYYPFIFLLPASDLGSTWARVLPKLDAGSTGI